MTPALAFIYQVTSDQRALNAVPAIIADLGDQAGWRYVEIFTATRTPAGVIFGRATSFSDGARTEA